MPFKVKNKLKRRMEIAKKSYGWLNARTGISREYLCRLANDQINNPKIETCLKIALALDIPVEKIWSLD